LAQLNAMTVPGPVVDIPVHGFESYLAVAGVLLAVENWLDAHPPGPHPTPPTATQIAMREMLRVVASPHSGMLGVSNPIVMTDVKNILNSIQAAGVMTTQQVNDIIAMSATTVSWWHANGYPAPINDSDLKAAGLV
jgi:hypothetical protein